MRVLSASRAASQPAAAGAPAGRGTSRDGRSALRPSGKNRFKHLVTGVPGLFVVSPPMLFRPLQQRMPLVDVAAMDAVEGRVTRLPEVRP